MALPPAASTFAPSSTAGGCGAVIIAGMVLDLLCRWRQSDRAELVLRDLRRRVQRVDRQQVGGRLAEVEWNEDVARIDARGDAGGHYHAAAPRLDSHRIAFCEPEA